MPIAAASKGPGISPPPTTMGFRSCARSALLWGVSARRGAGGAPSILSHRAGHGVRTGGGRAPVCPGARRKATALWSASSTAHMARMRRSIMEV